jgi:hypothetical protein
VSRSSEVIFGPEPELPEHDLEPSRGVALWAIGEHRRRPRRQRQAKDSSSWPSFAAITPGEPQQIPCSITAATVGSPWHLASPPARPGSSRIGCHHPARPGPVIRGERLPAATRPLSRRRRCVPAPSRVFLEFRGWRCCPCRGAHPGEHGSCGWGLTGAGVCVRGELRLVAGRGRGVAARCADVRGVRGGCGRTARSRGGPSSQDGGAARRDRSCP